MSRTLTCIICPRGCTLTVSDDVTVTGHACPRGEAYGIAECTAPTRTVTAVVRVADRPHTTLSVKTAAPIPKAHIFDAMARIRAAVATPPVRIGDVIIPDVYGTDIVATQNLD